MSNLFAFIAGIIGFGLYSGLMPPPISMLFAASFVGMVLFLS